MPNNLRAHHEEIFSTDSANTNEIYHPPFASLQEKSFDFANFTANSSAITALDLASNSTINTIKMCTLDQMHYLNSIIGTTIAVGAVIGATIGGCVGGYRSFQENVQHMEDECDPIHCIDLNILNTSLSAVLGLAIFIAIPLLGIGLEVIGIQMFDTEYQIPC